jgi:hypothetical protein
MNSSRPGPLWTRLRLVLVVAAGGCASAPAAAPSAAAPAAAAPLLYGATARATALNLAASTSHDLYVPSSMLQLVEAMCCD